MTPGSVPHQRGSLFPKRRGAASKAAQLSDTSQGETATNATPSGQAGAKHPESRIDPATSPLIDREGDGWVLTESTSPVLHLSPARRRFIARSAAAGKRTIIVTGEESVMTLALAEALQSLGGAWVVRSPHGYRDTRMGRRISRPEVVFEPDPAPQAAPEYARRPDAETTQISIMASIRQRNRRKASYGEGLELLADLLVDDATLDWGVAEPATLAWDAAQVAKYGRDSLAHNPWLVVNGVGTTGHAVTGTLRLRPTKQGAEEIVNVVADVGPQGSQSAAEALNDAPDMLAELVGNGNPLIAIAFARMGRADLHHGSTLGRAAAPLAIFIGVPAISRLSCPLSGLEATFGARIVGPARSRSIVVPLGDTISPKNAERLHEVLWALDPVALADALGSEFIDPLLGAHWREEATERAAASARADAARDGATQAEDPRLVEATAMRARGDDDWYNPNPNRKRGDADAS